MALNIYKPIDNCQHISILLPTRSRPKSLKKVFDSIQETTKEKNLLDIWVYVDHDDVITRDSIDGNFFCSYDFKINWFVGERTITMGARINTLREKCTTNPGIYVGAADDYLFVTEHWDSKVRDAFNAFPDRIALVYPMDPIAPDMVTFIWVSAEFTNATGRYITEFFPFWFDDTWLSQVGEMVQRKVKLDVRMEPIGGKGKTYNMRNTLFWQKFFDNTIDDRLQDARLLLQAIYPQKSYEYKNSVKTAAKMAKSFKAENKKITLEQLEILIDFEKNLSAVPRNSKPDEAYLLLESRATYHLWNKVGRLIKHGHIIDVLDILDNIWFAYKYLHDIQYRFVILERMFTFKRFVNEFNKMRLIAKEIIKGFLKRCLTLEQRIKIRRFFNRSCF